MIIITLIKMSSVTLKMAMHNLLLMSSINTHTFGTALLFIESVFRCDLSSCMCHKDSRHLNERQFDSDAVMERVLSFILGTSRWL